MDFSVNTEPSHRIHSHELNYIFKLRKFVFHDRLGWQVNCCDGMEYDAFDDDTAQYLTVKSNDVVIATCRIISTLRPTMLRAVFPQLLRGEILVASPEVSEISRLASAGSLSMTNGIMPIVLRGLRKHAQQNKIEQYVFVTTTSVERML
ncbi:hypothetical protein G6M12_25805 [Agrobacterium tumefaciens]|uniref:acyl-homoserine-lactone synthase n=1 Tax=Agrobacterium fabrum TaxID=1176649 RepID=UPI001574B2C0|nr:acyl-homoserine-lactone synthase [Agrobacterium fabrum]NTE84963.1 hypothetical protein [Agrobacterium tumefaciens]